MYMDEAVKKEVKDIFGGRCLGVVPAPSGKWAPLGLDAEGVLFIFILILLVVAAAAAAAIALHAVVLASSIDTESTAPG